MCGICGNAGFSDEPLLQEMANLIFHRGPDEGGFYNEADKVGLAIRRLRIIDLEKGGQPRYNEEGSVIVVFNGEIYNYQELREQLRSTGHQLTSNGDTEVIVHLYEEYGLDFVRHLRGMFAIALWDRQQERLVLVRDRLGIKPLYYWHESGRLLFGSEIKTVLESPAVERRVNYRALTNYLNYGFVPAPDTMFEGIKKLPPAHMLVWQKGTMHIHSYWEVEFTSNAGDPTVLEERLENTLEEAIRLHLLADVPLGAFLSGGIDSSLIVAMMAEQMNRAVDTFTVGFDTPGGYDESAAARLVSEYLGTNHHEVVVTEPDVDLMVKLVHHMDEPLADMAILPTYLVSKLARESGMTVVLTGEGADELFAGYSKYAVDRLLSYAYALPVSARRGVIDLLHYLPIAGRYKRAANRLLHPATQAERQLGWMRNNFSAIELQTLCSPELRLQLQPDADLLLRHNFEDGPQSSVAVMQRADIKTYMAEQLLMKVDRTTMAVSLEARVPYLDHCVVEVAAQVPESLKVSGLKTKMILRRLAEKRLPAETFNRKKHTFLVPVAEWLRGPWRELVEDTLLGSSFCTQRDGWFVPSKIQELVEQHLSGKVDHAGRLWSLMMLELWYQEFLLADPQSAPR